MGYNLNVSDKELQAKAEAIDVWNFAKKARKVLIVLHDEMGQSIGEDENQCTHQLQSAIKYAGVSFSDQESKAFLKMIIT